MLIRLEALRHAPCFEFWIVLGAVVTLLVLQAVEIIIFQLSYYDNHFIIIINASAILYAHARSLTRNNVALLALLAPDGVELHIYRYHKILCGLCFCISYRPHPQPLPLKGGECLRSPLRRTRRQQLPSLVGEGLGVGSVTTHTKSCRTTFSAVFF